MRPNPADSATLPVRTSLGVVLGLMQELCADDRAIVAAVERMLRTGQLRPGGGSLAAMEYAVDHPGAVVADQ
jgi:hypothetical protein